MLQAPGGSDPSLCSAWVCQSCDSHSASSPSQSAPCPCWVCCGPQHSCLNPSPSSQPGFGLCLRFNPNRSFPVCDAAGITFTAWVWSWFLSPRAKCCHTVTTRAQLLLHPASGQLDTRGAQEGGAELGPHVMFSLSTPQMFVSSLEKLLLGRWESGTCVVTSMSLVFLDVTPGVSLVCGSRDGPAAAPGLIPKVRSVHAPPEPRFGALQTPLPRFCCQH